MNTDTVVHAMKKIREAMRGQVNVNTLLNGVVLVLAAFALNKADAIYATLIKVDTWRVQHVQEADKETKALGDLSIRLASDEGRWRATAIETHSNTAAIKAIERKIGL